MKGKEKCRILKEIRRQIAQENDIEWVVEECTHKGDCRGTCPRCESEVAKLERELDIRRSIGKKIALAGIGVACLATLAGCKAAAKGLPEPGGDLEGAVEITEPGPDIEVLDGEVAIPDDVNDNDTQDIYDLSGYVPAE